MVRVTLGESLHLEDLVQIASGAPVTTRFPRAGRDHAQLSRQLVDQICSGDGAVYGVNTGFGGLAKYGIEKADLGRLQYNLLVSTACGVGEPITVEEARLALLLRTMSLARGYSGVRLKLIDWLSNWYASGWAPCIPAKGSVGASGDLAPLAHMALPIIGEGEMLDPEGRRVSAKVGLKKIGLAPLSLEAKEGLALINGMQVTLALGLRTWAFSRRLSQTADIAGALSVEALRASNKPFTGRLVNLRPHAGARRTAANLRRLLRKSEVMKSHADCDRVQDPYSFRCMPQVHGAAKHALDYAGEVLLTEANSVTDNPSVFEAHGDVISGGNFHGQPLGLVLDHLAAALATWANMSERRQATLVDPAMSGLPAFLAPEPGLDTGFMIPQVTAAALCSENKVLAQPASVDSIPTSANQEDFVSMAMLAARKARQAALNTARVLAIELYAAAQGREFHRELRAGDGVEAAYRLVRKQVEPLKHDRYMAPDIDRLVALVRSGDLVVAAEKACGQLKP